MNRRLCNFWRYAPAHSRSAFIRRPLLWIGGAAAVLAFGLVVAHRFTQQGAGAAHSSPPDKASAILVSKPVKSHPVLPVAISGQPREKIELPGSVRDALCGKELSWDARLRFIGNLGTSLSSADVQLLVNYIKQVQPDDGLQVEQRRAFKNDIIFALRSQQTAPRELTACLVGIYRDKAQDPGMRDYAIQHLSEWRWRAVQQSAGAARTIDETLWAAAQDSTAAGTALLALRRLVDDTQMPDHAAYAAEYQQRLSRTALAIAANEKAPLAARITAIGLCSPSNPQGNSSPNVAPAASETAALLTGILRQADSPPTLQLAALGALSKTLSPKTALDAPTRTVLETASRSTYSPLQNLALTTLRKHSL